jgi:transposase
MIHCIGCKSHIKKEPKYKQRSKVKRDDYLKQLSEIDINKLVYLYEMGVDNDIVPLYGWACKGKKSYAEKIAFKTERVSIIGAYRYADKQIIAPFEYTGYTDRSLFSAWFEKFLCPELKVGDYVILDNAPIHHKEELLDISKLYQLNLIFLPAYSPDLNPIEKVWANFKRHLRKLIKKAKSFKDAITESFHETFSG